MKMQIFQFLTIFANVAKMETEKLCTIMYADILIFANFLAIYANFWQFIPIFANANVA